MKKNSNNQDFKLPASPLPVVLAAGFLGSGKTTLMRRLIVDAHQRGLRAAVVVNEFGTADVDSNILREAEAELVASIAGGCACCSGQNELQDTLMELGLRPQETRPDVILIEASGLADPVLLLDVATDPGLLSLVEARSIIAVVDGARYLELATTLAPLLRRQIQLADLLLLNKKDIARQLDDIEEKLRGLNSSAEIVRTEQCAIDLAGLWRRVLEGGSIERDSDDAGEPAAHLHYHTVVCPLPHPLERAALEAALQSLPPEVWRAKGFVRLRGEAGLQLVQYTGGGETGRYQIVPFYLPPVGLEPEAALVFIGAALDKQELLARFSSNSNLIAFL